MVIVDDEVAAPVGIGVGDVILRRALASDYHDPDELAVEVHIRGCTVKDTAALLHARFDGTLAHAESA